MLHTKKINIEYVPNGFSVNWDEQEGNTFSKHSTLVSAHRELLKLLDRLVSQLPKGK